jgi:hypothetical protein
MNKTFHNVGEKINFVNDCMIIQIDGKEYKFRLEEISVSLLNASQTEREYYKLDSDGYGIHWQLIDEDLSVDGLLGIKHYPPSKKLKEKAA